MSLKGTVSYDNLNINPDCFMFSACVGASAGRHISSFIKNGYFSNILHFNYRWNRNGDFFVVAQEI